MSVTVTCQNCRKSFQAAPTKATPSKRTNYARNLKKQKSDAQPTCPTTDFIVVLSH